MGISPAAKRLSGSLVLPACAPREDMHRSWVQIVVATLLLLGATTCVSQTSANSYNAQLKSLENAWTTASAPDAPALLARMYALREYVDDPAAIARRMAQVSQDAQQDRLVRDEALHYLARMQRHEGRTLPTLSRENHAGQGWATPSENRAGQGWATPSENRAGQGWATPSENHAGQGWATPERKVLKSIDAERAKPGRAQDDAGVGASPEPVSANVRQAEYYVGRKQLEKARDLLRQAIAAAPNDYVARERLAELYAAAGLKSVALAEYRRLEAEFPAPVWLRRELARRYEELGLLDQAEALAQSALAQDFDGREEREVLLRIYARRGEAEKLRACYAEMARLHPDDPQPLAKLAQLEAGAGRFEAAEKAMRAALAIAPGDDKLHAGLADLLAEAGKSDESRRELAAALALNPNSESLRLRPTSEIPTLSRENRAGQGWATRPTSEVPTLSRENRAGQGWATRPTTTDTDAQYLVDAAELAAQAQRAPPQDAAKVVELADVRLERVSDNGLSSVRAQQVYYIASEPGAREYASRAVQYAAATQKLRILAARAYKPDGRVIEAEDAGESSVEEGGAAMYYDARWRTLRFSGLEKGDVVELDYRLSPESNVNPYGDYFGDLVVFRSAIPEKLQRYVLLTPAARNFNVVEERMPSPAEVRVENGLRVYRWEARDLAALPNEPRAPALTEIAPYVHVSSFLSWQDLGRWYAQLIAPQFALDAALRGALQQMVAGKKTELEKISAIHQFVLRNTHYVALEFGIYGYKPYPVSQVYARRYGDCKDKASLMIALLRAAGTEAEIALVRTRRLGEIGERATSIAIFNHAIVYVPKYKLWLDGTAEYAGSRELPLDDQGAMALTVAQDGSAQLRRIPVTLPMENYTHRSVQAQIEPDGKIQFSGSAYTRGEDAPGLRRDFEIAERQRDCFRNRLAEVLPSVRVEQVQVYGAHDLEDDVTVRFRGELDAFAGRATLSLGASWMKRSYVQTLAALASRTQDVLLPAPWTTEEELHFALPAGARLQSVPQDKTLDTPYGTAVLRYQRRGNELVVTTSVQFRKLRITPAEYAGFREFCAQVEAAFRAEIKVELKG